MIATPLDAFGLFASLALFFVGSAWATSIAKSLTPQETARLTALLPNDGAMLAMGLLFILAFVAPMNPLVVLLLAGVCAVAAAHFGPLRVAKVAIAAPARGRLLAANWTLWIASTIFVFVRTIPRLIQ